MLALIYIALGWWSYPRVMWKNRTVYGTSKAINMERLTMGFLCGWFTIPLAIIGLFTGNRR